MGANITWSYSKDTDLDVDPFLLGQSFILVHKDSFCHDGHGKEVKEVLLDGVGDS